MQNKMYEKFSYNIYSRVKSSAALHRAFNVDPLYLQHENAGVAIDYMVCDYYL
jgi:hypothetical protein